MAKENMSGKMVNIMKENSKMDLEMGWEDGIFHKKPSTKDNLKETSSMVMESNHFKMEIIMKDNMFKE